MKLTLFIIFSLTSLCFVDDTDDMNTLKGPNVSVIEAIPGLFISDRFTARSLPLLHSHNITHVLSLTHSTDTPSFKPSDGIVWKHLEIHDDPTEDLLIHLTEVCDWIDAALSSASLATEDDVSGEEKKKKKGKGRVLVHCNQGISRSGSVIVAYMMRTLHLDYLPTLSLAREYRPIINPNCGFEGQLKVWEDCKFDIYLSDGKPKAAYKYWRSERDALLRRGVDAVQSVRVGAMASMAARFGQLRMEKMEREEDKKG